MCVTNNVRRAPRPLAVANPSMLASTPSMLSQRLLSNYMPLMGNSTNNGDSMPLNMPKSAPCAPQQGVQTIRSEKPKPKRRRKPQKPGKTAKLNERHFVVHNYHDHANEAPENDVQVMPKPRRRGGVSTSFPMKLHSILDQVEADGLAHVISWQPHGRCFVIHDPKEFSDHVMPNYFRQTKLTSFQRQLNLYGFSRLTTGKDNGGYYHELFLRGKIFLAKRMQRTKIKGTKFKAASSPDQEPDFYQMPPILVTPNTTCDEASSSSDEDTTFSPVTSRIVQSSWPTSASGGGTLITPEVPMLEPYPVLSRPSRPVPLQEQVASIVPLDWKNNTVAASAPRPSSSDNAFDEAVDEIYYEEDPLMNDQDYLNNIWDPSMEVTEEIQNDEQLGYLLESLLTA